MPTHTELAPKGLSIEKCRERAGILIAEFGMCLLLLDMADSKSDFWRHLHGQFYKMVDEVVDLEPSFFPENRLATITRTDKGFYVVGDSAVAGINDVEAINHVTSYIDSAYPELRLHYGVARDGYDRENLKVVR